MIFPLLNSGRRARASKRFLVLFLLLQIVNNKHYAIATLFYTNPSRPRHHHQRRIAAIERLKQMIPPPSTHELGGEEADDAAYARFLSVVDWDPARAAPRLERSIEWRKRVRPGTLRPHHCDTLCRQRAWVALLTAAGGRGGGGGGGSPCDFDSSDAPNDDDRTRRGRRRRPPLDTPHNCPPLRSWRRTRHGLPVTYFRCWMWRPNEASGEEMERHMAYHMHHLIRRMRGNVERMCVVFDMRGFEGWMLPYVRQAVDVLRQHYPGRAGAMAFINVPGYFRAVWKIISPWLDDEIRSKTFFAPKEVDDVEKVIRYLNGMNLKTGPA